MTVMDEKQARNKKLAGRKNDPLRRVLLSSVRKEMVACGCRATPPWQSTHPHRPKDTESVEGRTSTSTGRRRDDDDGLVATRYARIEKFNNLRRARKSESPYSALSFSFPFARFYWFSVYLFPFRTVFAKRVTRYSWC